MSLEENAAAGDDDLIRVRREGNFSLVTILLVFEYLLQVKFFVTHNDSFIAGFVL